MEKNNSVRKEILEDCASNLDYIFNSVKEDLSKESSIIFSCLVESIKEDAYVIDKMSTKDMISCYKVGNRYVLSKDTRAGENNYSRIENLTRNDLIHIKQSIEEILKEDK